MNNSSSGDSMNTRKMNVLLVLWLIPFLSPPGGLACSALFLDSTEGVLCAENFDWNVRDGLVMINKRNIKKAALVLRGDDCVPAVWTSRYGSITFNHVAREFFHGGMNEKGLFITGLLLPGSRYPPHDSRPVVSSTQWKQYVVDNFSTVKETLAAHDRVRVWSRTGRYPTHYFLCDRTGDCAVIEFLEGEMVVYRGKDLPVKVLTNNRYLDSVQYLKKHNGFGGSQPFSAGTGSLARFARASGMVARFDPKKNRSAADHAFQILEEVSQGAYTVWRVVYDLKNLRIRFRTIDQPRIRYVDFKSFDFSCTTPVKVLDMAKTLSGDVSKAFVDYSTRINREFVGKINGFYRFPGSVVDALARHPEGLKCAAE